jgi:hypothetical protein
MASGHVNRVNRPNTWLHRPMLQTFKKVLANSEPSTHGGRADFSGPSSEANAPEITFSVLLCEMAIRDLKNAWQIPVPHLAPNVRF